MTTGAGILVDRCLLQPVAGGLEYGVDDLVLEYLQLAIRMDDDLAKLASSRQASFLGRVDVLQGYATVGDDPATSGGMNALLALWNSAKKLDETLSVQRYYEGSLEGVTDFETWRATGRLLHLMVSLKLQGSMAPGFTLAFGGSGMQRPTGLCSRRRLTEARPSTHPHESCAGQLSRCG